MMAIRFARRVMLAAVVIALIGSAAGPRADAPLAAPESVGFSADGLQTFQRTMRALVDEGLVGVAMMPTGGSPQVRPLSRQLVYQALVDRKK
jgi:hypothetical protein